MAKGLAMYESLKRHSSEPFSLKILPLDDESEVALETMRLPDVIVLGTRAFVQDQRLEEIKQARSAQHYAWTCASQLCEWLLFCADCEFSEITYLDADLFYFSDPEPIFGEIGDRSIGIIPHRLIPSKRHLEVNGKFNVGMVHFKNTDAGRHCLSTWAAQVRERCDSATCGDQKYLDEWPGRYGDELSIIQNIGANVAPWNVANYELTEGPKVDGLPVIFYHFHEYIHGERLTNYQLRPEDIEFIYKPYIAAIQEAEDRIAVLSVIA